MAVDLQMLQNIHHLPGVINAAIREVKSLLEQRDERIKDLPQYQALQDALAVIAEARTRLKIAIETDPELNRLQEEIAEAMFNMRDLREILSHHLVAYHKETGRIQQARSGRNPLAPPGGLPRRDWPDVIKDMESRNRKIEFRPSSASQRWTRPGCRWDSANTSASVSLSL
jgi:hypothetical protein